MIFRQLFQPKYKHTDPLIRIEAIESLSPEQQEHKTVLHELAFNDGDPNVSIAALERLNSFSLWCKVAQSSNSDRLRKKAQAKVESVLFNQDSALISEKDKLTFARECKQIPMLEKLLRQPWLYQSHPEVVIQLLDKVGKPHVELQVFQATENEQLQLALVNRMHDLSMLNKALKKTQISSVASHISMLIEQYKVRQQKPTVINQQAKLTLSQLLALSDKLDMDIVIEQKDLLDKQFNGLKTDFNLLTQAQREYFEIRYIEVLSQVNAHIDKHLPLWQETKQQQLKVQELSDSVQNAQDILTAVNQMLSGDFEAITLGQIEQFEQQIRQANESLQNAQNAPTDQASLSRKHIEKLFNRLNATAHTLSRLPELQVAIAKGKALIADIRNHQLPDNPKQYEQAKQQLKSWQQEWAAITRSFSENWPSQISQDFNQQISVWKKALNKLDSHISQLSKKAMSKCKAVENLIEQGKYKAAMSVFEKVDGLLVDLEKVTLKTGLQRQLEKVQQRIANLKEWQGYIAKPRKPQVLEEARALAETPLEIQAQSQAVKRMRQQWQSFGELGTAEDDQLNQAFNRAIEQAFEPCRQHFAQQEQLRKANLKAKQQVIDELTKLPVQDQDVAEVQRGFNQLQKQWSSIGPVDFAVKDEIHKQYQDTCKPIKSVIRQYHKDNELAKQQIIEQAQGLIGQENTQEAVTRAKQLQEKWKSVGPAVFKVEQKLWKIFRQANDEIFEGHRLANSQQKERQDTHSQAIAAQLSEINIDAVCTVEQLQDVKAQFQKVLQASRSEAFSLEPKVHATLNNVERQIQQAQKKVESLAKQHTFGRVIALLEQWQVGANFEGSQLDELPNAWRMAFLQPKQNGEYDRGDLLVLMELLAEHPSPSAENDRRKALKLALMTNKLQGGAQPDSTDLLKSFIGFGPMSKNESGMLKRLRKLWCPSLND